MCLQIASKQSATGNETRLFLSPFLVSASWFGILAEVLRNDHVATGSTAIHSATEKNEIGGYVTVPCSSKLAQRSSAADWIKN